MLLHFLELLEALFNILFELRRYLSADFGELSVDHPANHLEPFFSLLGNRYQLLSQGFLVFRERVAQLAARLAQRPSLLVRETFEPLFSRAPEVVNATLQLAKRILERRRLLGTTLLQLPFNRLPHVGECAREPVGDFLPEIALGVFKALRHIRLN